MRLFGALLSVGFLSGCLCIVGSGSASSFATGRAFYHCDDDRDLDISWRCDGMIDCSDKTDERNCDYEDCKADDKDRFFCRSDKRCILKEFVCDGKADCADRSDELNCTEKMPCLSEFFACADGSNCVPRSFMCDGHPECLDKSDESKEICHGTLHGYGVCKNRFKCGMGLCLEDDKFVCDGKPNCPDGRDESSETCLSHPDCKNCTQLCTRHSHGAICGCNPGFELDKDGGSCIDVDECARGSCSQICHNSIGSFKCGCRAGFKKINETKCENLDKATFVWYRGDAAKGRYIILERDGRERKIRIPGTVADDHVPPSIMPRMAFDIDNEKLYIRVGNSLYSMQTQNRRNARPALIRVLAPRVQMTDFAVDYATGNVYFTTLKGTAINICDVDGSCFPYVSRRRDIVSRVQIARLANGTRVFWQEGSKIMSGSLDGSEISHVFKILGGEAIRYFVVDEQSEKMYLALTNLLEVDLATSRTKILTRLDYDLSGKMFWNMAVHDDVILIQVVDAESAIRLKSKQLVNKILQIDRLTGDHLGPLEAPALLQLHSICRKSKTPLQNPCSRNKCSHICVPDSSSNSYKCLCPPGMHLDDGNDQSCIPQEGEEVIYFVNGTSVSTYVYEDDELFLNSNFNLKFAPLAIATTLDMNLIFSTHQRLYELRRDGSTKAYSGVRGARAMVLDPTDDVLYAANEYELLAVNLKTSLVALIRNSVDIKHMDIDPFNRIIYAETMNSKLISMEIGVWEDSVLAKVPSSSDDGQRTWAFDPSARSIQTEVSLVLEKGYCDLVHDDQLGFDCHRHGWLVKRCAHSTNETRFLARAGSPLVPLKGSACGTSGCEFCVSARGKTLLEPVCVCPYGHELGADGKTCSKSCGLQMLRCTSEDGKCVHQSTRCDGVRDCVDGSDELHCEEHDCHGNFKCSYDGNCISKKFVCDGNYDCSDASDEEHCRARNCTVAQFMCEGGECISRFKRCDGKRDCFHGDDEKKCSKVACKENQFDCGNNTCISREWVCDSRADCPHGEDEADCSSLKSKKGKHDCDSKWIFCCKSGEQLPASMRCNGIDECEDRSDETDCKTTCGAPRFLCDDGACLQESEVCDGIPHCPNKADEHMCRNQCWKKDLFECRAEGICLPKDKLCDGKRDCFDGADEAKEICILKSPTPVNSSCSADEFKCRSGQCIPLDQVCDDKRQCEDGTDEGVFCKKVDCKAAGCSQSCFAGGPRGVTCTCHKGYSLMEDGYTCDDIDECVKTPEVCSQFCTNQKGGYECSCAPGFIKSPNGECRVEDGDAIVLIVENGVVETINRNRDRSMVLNLPGAHIGGIEYDAATGLVFVSDTDNNKIHRIPLNQANGLYKHETYTQLKPGALAFDWVTGNLYFADHRPSIHVCNRSMAGAYCRILTEVNVKPTPGAPPPSITSIALVPDEGIMFYAESSTGFIFRQNMDGTEKSTFRWAAGEKRPLSLTVDHIHRTLYWVDAHSGSIESSNLKGEKIRRIATHLSFVRTFAIFEDYLVFPEPSNENWVIMHKGTGKIKSSKYSPLGRVTEVKIMHQVNQPHEINRCSRNPCQQMCLLKPHDFACACIDGQELSEDNHTCIKASIDDSELIDERWKEKLQSHCSCENGGECTVSKMKKDSFYCKCPAGYHGSRCESGPTRSLVLTVFLICTFFIVVAGAGVYLMLLAAKKDRRRRAAQAQEGSDRLTLVEKDNDDDF